MSISGLTFAAQVSQTLCLFCCRHFKCENHFSWHHCLRLHKTQRRPSSGLYQTDCEQTKLPKMIYLLVFRRWMEPKYIRPDCQLRPKKVYFSIRHNAVNGSLRTFEPSQNNLIHWPNSIQNLFARADNEAPIEHIKSALRPLNLSKVFLTGLYALRDLFTTLRLWQNHS